MDLLEKIKSLFDGKKIDEAVYNELVAEPEKPVETPKQAEPTKETTADKAGDTTTEPIKAEETQDKPVETTTETVADEKAGEKSEKDNALLKSMEDKEKENESLRSQLEELKKANAGYDARLKAVEEDNAKIAKLLNKEDIGVGSKGVFGGSGKSQGDIEHEAFMSKHGNIVR